MHPYQEGIVIKKVIASLQLQNFSNLVQAGPISFVEETELSWSFSFMIKCPNLTQEEIEQSSTEMTTSLSFTKYTWMVLKLKSSVWYFWWWIHEIWFPLIIIVLGGQCYNAGDKHCTLLFAIIFALNFSWFATNIISST